MSALAPTGSARSVVERIDELAALTEVPGEITRPYGTPSLAAAQDAARTWMERAGLEVRRDALGTVTGRRGASSLPALVLGSHLDSVRDAGRWDGPLGVLVGLAVAERLREVELPFALEVVSFADEEGLRFRSSYLASRVFAGTFDEEELAFRDDGGATLADGVRAMGGDPGGLTGARREPRELLGYLEVHIEQGPVLEDEDLPVGVVTAIAGQSRGSVELIGRAGHAGNTPPRLRLDALCGAAELVLAAERAMSEREGLVATVGRLDCRPNVGNVIPGLVTLSYDVRHQSDREKEAAVEDLRREADAICHRRGLAYEWRHLQDHPAVPMSPRLRALLVRAVGECGVRPRELPSGAGHDAVQVAHLTEVAMLFVRCRGGVSHHPDESVREEDVALAVDAVERFVRRLASEGAG